MQDCSILSACALINLMLYNWQVCLFMFFLRLFYWYGDITVLTPECLSALVVTWSSHEYRLFSILCRTDVSADTLAAFFLSRTIRPPKRQRVFKTRWISWGDDLVHSWKRHARMASCLSKTSWFWLKIIFQNFYVVHARVDHIDCKRCSFCQCRITLNVP